MLHRYTLIQSINHWTSIRRAPTLRFVFQQSVWKNTCAEMVFFFYHSCQRHCCGPAIYISTSGRLQGNYVLLFFTRRLQRNSKQRRSITSCPFPSAAVTPWQARIYDFCFCPTSVPQSHTHKLNSCHGTGSSAALSFLLAHPPVGDISAADNTQRRRRHGENGGRPHKLSKQGHQRLSHWDTYRFSFASCRTIMRRLQPGLIIMFDKRHCKP